MRPRATWDVLPILTVAFSLVGARYWKVFVQCEDHGNQKADSRQSDEENEIRVHTRSPQTHQGSGGEILVGYLARLTYSYHNPDLQMGDYCRSFDPGEEEDVKVWAGPHNCSTNTPHVDRRDVSSSLI